MYHISADTYQHFNRADSVENQLWYYGISFNTGEKQYIVTPVQTNVPKH